MLAAARLGARVRLTVVTRVARFVAPSIGSGALLLTHALPRLPKDRCSHGIGNGRLHVLVASGWGQGRGGSRNRYRYFWSGWPGCARVVGFEPIERRVHFRIHHQPGATLDEIRALLRVFHQAGSFSLVGPRFDFLWCSAGAVGVQPIGDFFISFRGGDGGFELVGGDAFETEKNVIQQAIEMIVAERSVEAGAAFVDGAACDDEAADAFARALGGAFAEVFGNDGCAHNSCSISAPGICVKEPEPILYTL